MIDEKLLQDYVRNLAGSTEYRIQIIDINGFVIASDQPKNIKAFHETAYKLLKGNTPLSNQHAKTADGVLTLCLPLSQGNQPFGVLEMSGDEKTVRAQANIVKLSIETMVGCYQNAEKFQRYSNKFDLFIQRLFYDPQASSDELESRAAALGYSCDCMRIPVFIVTEPVGDMKNLLQQGNLNPHHHSQDILALSRSNHIILYIHLGYGESVLCDYRETVSQYLEWWQASLAAMGLQAKMYVGTIQSNLSYYHIGYYHAVWLHNTAHCQEPINWFYDYTELYLKRSIPLMEYRGIFNVFSENLPSSFLLYYVNLIGGLSECDYSLLPASKKLFIHKNTLMFRLKKIKESLNINPIQNHRDREFANNLYLYLKSLS